MLGILTGIEKKWDAVKIPSLIRTLTIHKHTIQKHINNKQMDNYQNTHLPKYSTKPKFNWGTVFILSYLHINKYQWSFSEAKIHKFKK